MLKMEGDMRYIQSYIYTFLLVVLLSNRFVFADELGELILVSQPVLLEELEQERGMGGVVDITTYNNANLEASLADNSAVNNSTGFNIIDHGAFTEASGFVSVIQNTGNNVIIQDSTIINVTIAP